MFFTAKTKNVKLAMKQPKYFSKKDIITTNLQHK